MSSVLGLKASPQRAKRRPARPLAPPKCWLIKPCRRCFWNWLHRFHGLEQLGHVARLLGSAHQGLHVFGEAGAAITATGPDELEADALVRANANADALDVGAETLDQVASSFMNEILVASMALAATLVSSTRSKQGLMPAEWAGAAEATILLNQRAPHELQPCQRSGLSPCALPARPPGRLVRRNRAVPRPGPPAASAAALGCGRWWYRLGGRSGG